MDSDEFDLSNSTTYHSDKINFGEADEGEIMYQPRQRTNVDYKKLHDVSLIDSMLFACLIFLLMLPAKIKCYPKQVA